MHALSFNITLTLEKQMVLKTALPCLFSFLALLSRDKPILVGYFCISALWTLIRGVISARKIIDVRVLCSTCILDTL